MTDPASVLLFAVYGDNRWSPVHGGAGGEGADTLDLRRSPRSSSSQSRSRWLTPLTVAASAEEEEEYGEPLDSFSAASQWWARQDRSAGGDEYRDAAAGWTDEKAFHSDAVSLCKSTHLKLLHNLIIIQDISLHNSLKFVRALLGMF